MLRAQQAKMDLSFARYYLLKCACSSCTVEHVKQKVLAVLALLSMFSAEMLALLNLWSMSSNGYDSPRLGAKLGEQCNI